MKGLTKRQRDALVTIQLQAPMSSAQLAERLDTSPEGAAQTAASLVRRGLVTRERLSGRVHFRPVTKP